MNINKRPSPNFDQRPAAVAPSVLVLHYTGMKSTQQAIERLCDPASHVSAHYILTEEGEVLQLVDEAMRAWHAGVSHWRGERSINDISIGIELANPGHEFGYTPYPKPQMASLEELCIDIVRSTLSSQSMWSATQISHPGESRIRVNCLIGKGWPKAVLVCGWGKRTIFPDKVWKARAQRPTGRRSRLR